MPEGLTFQTKPQIGLKMIRHVQRQQIPFHAVLLDTLYGRNQELRTALDGSGIEYYADVPSTTKVYASPPVIHHPIGRRGKPSKHPEFKGVLQEVQQLRETLEKQRICIRPNERGYLCAWWSRSRVWVRYGDTVREEWLLIRHDESGKLTYVLSNAPVSRRLEEMAWRKTHRYLIERSHQDAKSELGWDEFQARKYQAWTHHLALTILACWFIAQTRLDWNERFHRDPQLLKQYEVEVLPQLSVANVRILLRAALPLPNLSPEQAAQLIKDHLANRTRSRKSRLRREEKK
jgi:SRSO17 transposase